MSKNKLYYIALLACLLGLIYLFYSQHFSESTHFKLCIFKNLTGYPCPSCGTTRAIHFLLEGKIQSSLLMNPFGILVAGIMFVIPIWILYDLVAKKETFFINYKKTEHIINRKWIAFLLIVLVILNWIWNIKKGL
jgi:hypothetical protein